MKLDAAYVLPVSLSVVMHLALLAAVTWGWQAGTVSTQVYTPKYVEARLVQLKPKAIKKQAAKKKIRKVDLAAKRREQERQAKLADQKRRIDLAKKEKALKEKQRQEELERERLLNEQRREEELLRQQEMESQFSDALDDEEEFMQSEDDERKAQSYVALITTRIEQNWSRPPSARKGMVCELLLQMVPTGKVVSVSVVKGSGSAAFDRSAEQAVKKAEQFPELQGMPPQVFERYFRQIRIIFNPKDLRL